MSATDRGRGIGAERRLEKTRGQTLSRSQIVALQANLLRVPARDLDSWLKDALPPADASKEETENAEGETEAEDAPDMEDWAEDAEGDATEPEESWPLDDLPAAETRVPQRDDVLLRQVETEAGPQWFLISGLSDLLFSVMGQGSVAHTRRMALRRRVADTLAVARLAQQEYGWEGLAAPPAPGQGRLLRAGATATLARDKAYLASLLSAATLQTPGGQSCFLHAFFADERSGKESESLRRLLRALAEHSEKDRQAPLSDEALTERSGLARSTVQTARTGLGVPTASDRARRYAAGQSLPAMAASGPEARARLGLWRQCLSSKTFTAHENARTRQTAADWLAEVDARQDSLPMEDA